MDYENTITIEGRSVLLKRKGRSQKVAGQILGEEIIEGSRYTYLDRLIHEPHEQELGEYRVEGAISSILIKAR